MATTTPLTPAPSTTLNFSTPPTTTAATKRYETYEVRTYTTHSTRKAAPDSEDGNSSPFMPQAKDDQENPAPAPISARPGSRILSGTELSPLKILQYQQAQQLQSPTSGDETSTTFHSMPPPAATPRSPRKMTGPEKRFPIRVNPTPSSSSSSSSAAEATPRANRPHHERQMSLEEVIQENEGLKHAINIFEDEVSVLEGGGSEKATDSDKATIGADVHELERDEELVGPDDTMISTLSTFSAVPNLTMLAQMRSDSPTRFSTFGGGGDATPRGYNNADTAAIRTPRAGPLPNRVAQYESSGNTTSLMDFTEQLRTGAYQPQSPPRKGATSPSKGRAPAGGVAATPQRNSPMNLLDFDIPPLPTPRSIPTITPRELESLKSGFLSEISSLKASLSGKEAEVSSLKTAVGDAEKRVGESLEQLREVRSQQEALASEQEGWERRGREMEAVLRKVKGEIVLSQREREELEAKLDEADKRREAAEMMAQEAESKMAGMRAGRASADAAGGGGGGGSSTPDRMRSPGSGGTNKEVEIAVERVARELHALYKSKHETKVAALKKSYENRWEKRVREVEARAEELARENEELRVGRDATMTRVDPARLAELEAEREAERARDAAQIRGLEAEVEKLEAVVGTVKADNADLRAMLEKERVEKGELVILAEEMMGMQSFVASSAPTEPTTKESRRMTCPSTPSSSVAKGRVPPSPAPGTASRENGNGTAKSNRMSGLRAPGSVAAGSRIGRVTHGRTGSSGLARPGSGMAVRSGIMSSIEKMGSYRGRGE